VAAKLGTILGAAIVWFTLGYFVGKDAKECQTVPSAKPAYRIVM
jgi:hypothetical protein